MADPTITVRIKGDQSQLNAELQKSQQGVMNFASGLKTLAATIGAAFSIRAVAGFAGQLMREADAIVTYAEGIGESVKNVVALRKAAGEGGVQTEKMLNWLQRIVDAQDKIGRDGGMSTLAKSLEYAGISAEKFISLAPAEAFNLITQAARESGKGVAVLNEVLGRAAASDAMDVNKIIEAAGGWDKYAASVSQAAAAIDRLAGSQDRVDAFFQGFKERAIIALDAAIQGGIKAWNTITSGRWVSSPASFEDIVTSLGGQAGDTMGRGAGGAQYPNAKLDAQGRAAVEKMRDDFIAKTNADANQAMLERQTTGFLRQLKSSAQQSYSDMLNVSDKPEEVKRLKSWIESIDKAIDATEKRAKQESEWNRDAAERLGKMKKIYDDEAEKINQVYVRGMEQTQAIRVDMPRLSGIESLGAILGGTGGYANAMVQRQQKMIEIQQRLDASLAEIKTNTAEAAAALKGDA